MPLFRIHEAEFEITEKNEMPTPEFTRLISAIDSFTGDVNSLQQYIQEMAYVLRFSYLQAKELYSKAFNLEADPKKKFCISLSQLGLEIQHFKANRNTPLDNEEAIKSHLLKYGETNDRRIDYLKGLYFMYLHQYEDALFSFEKAGYKKGVNTIYVLKNDKDAVSRCNDLILKCYASSKYWNSCNILSDNKNFNYVIGKSSDYTDENNLDVKLKIINDRVDCILSSCSNDSVLKEYAKELDQVTKELIELSNHARPSAYLYYSIGKICHIKKDFSLAADFYNRSLSVENDYPPSKFNLCKIQEVIYPGNHKSQSVTDYNSIVNIKHNQEIDTGNCSDLVRKLCNTIMLSRNLDVSILSDLQGLKHYFKQDAYINNISIIKASGIESGQCINSIIDDLKSLLNTCGSSIKHYVLYNIALISNDCSLFESIKNDMQVPAELQNYAQLHLDLLNGNNSTEDPNLRAYLTKDLEVLEKMDSAFSQLLQSYIWIEQAIQNSDQHVVSSMLEKAEKSLRQVANSKYAANGLGIIAAIRGNLLSAIKIFSQIAVEYPGSYKNLAYCYYFTQDYKKALDCFTNYIKIFSKKNPKSFVSNLDIKILSKASEQVSDISKLNVLIDILQDVDSELSEILQKTRVSLLASTGDIQKLEALSISDPMIQKKIEEAKQKDAERKKKIAEMEEYRKRRRME